jgi:hypothetical protein
MHCFSVARSNPIGDTISCITNMLRDTSIAMSIGPILEAYSSYTGPTTVGGGESDKKSIFIALPTAENSTINFQYSDTLAGVPDNFLSRSSGEALNETFIPKEDYAATLVLYVNGLRHQTKAPDDSWYMKHGNAIILLTDLALACFSHQKIQPFPKELADSISKAPNQWRLVDELKRDPSKSMPGRTRPLRRKISQCLSATASNYHW